MVILKLQSGLRAFSMVLFIGLICWLYIRFLLLLHKWTVSFHLTIWMCALAGDWFCWCNYSYLCGAIRTWCLKTSLGCSISSETINRWISLEILKPYCTCSLSISLIGSLTIIKSWSYFRFSPVCFKAERIHWKGQTNCYYLKLVVQCHTFFGWRWTSTIYQFSNFNMLSCRWGTWTLVIQ